MPFSVLQNEQQIEVVVAGPGDVTRLYVCNGLATGEYLLNVPAGQSQLTNDAWQFEVGPQLAVNQFRRAIATASLAGLQEHDSGSGVVTLGITVVYADFNDDAGKVRVNVTMAMSVSNAAGAQTNEFSGVPALGYGVSILAAMPANA